MNAVKLKVYLIGLDVLSTLVRNLRAHIYNFAKFIVEEAVRYNAYGIAICVNSHYYTHIFRHLYFLLKCNQYYTGIYFMSAKCGKKHSF